jgi:hypothetical protein
MNNKRKMEKKKKKNISSKCWEYVRKKEPSSTVGENIN